MAAVVRGLNFVPLLFKDGTHLETEIFVIVNDEDTGHVNRADTA